MYQLLDKLFGKKGAASSQTSSVEQVTTPLSNKFIEEIPKCQFPIENSQTLSDAIFVCGRNNQDQLGFPSFDNFAIPRLLRPSFLRGEVLVSQIACGAYHTSILTNYRSVHSAGCNSHNQLLVSSPKNREPVYAQLGTIDVDEVRCGAFNTILIARDRTRLFFSSSISWGMKMLNEVVVGEPIQDVQAGDKHIMILTTSSNLYWLGANYYGQCGAGAIGESNSPTLCSKVVVADILRADFKKIRCGAFFTVLLNSDNKVYVTGDNSNGQIGIPTEKKVTQFTRLECEELRRFDILDFACGENFTVFLTTDAIVGFGSNQFGQLCHTGTYGQIHNVTPVVTPHNFLRVESVSCGQAHTMILTNKGVFASGRNTNGELGLGYFGPVKSMQRVRIQQPLAVVCGYAHTTFLCRKYLGTLFVNYAQQMEENRASGHTDIMIRTSTR